jgi:hypothetical protein
MNVNTRWLPGRIFKVLAAALMMAAVLMGVTGGASASTRVSWSRVQTPSPGSFYNTLNGVTVLSSRNAWAVGTYDNASSGRTLIEHWNGTSWARVPSPGGSSNPSVLQGVAATSPGNAWAVGGSDSGTGRQTLIERWNGTAWRRVPSPSPGGSSVSNTLSGVAATSSGNAWAVGAYQQGTVFQTLIEHWNGTAWRRVPSPNPGGSSASNTLSGITATSSGNAWAVGTYQHGTVFQTLIEHWNGTVWRRVPSPNAGGSSINNGLSGIAATSPGNAWAVGDYYNGTAQQTLTEHWNGTAWRRVPSPNPGGSSANNTLSGITATSPGNAWAVGEYSGRTDAQTLVEHWNGTAWRRVPSPDPGGSSNPNVLHGVAATSSGNAWAVGEYFNGTATQTLALRCC